MKILETLQNGAIDINADRDVADAGWEMQSKFKTWIWNGRLILRRVLKIDKDSPTAKDITRRALLEFNSFVIDFLLNGGAHPTGNLLGYKEAGVDCLREFAIVSRRGNIVSRKYDEGSLPENWQELVRQHVMVRLGYHWDDGFLPVAKEAGGENQLFKSNISIDKVI